MKSFFATTNTHRRFANNRRFNKEGGILESVDMELYHEPTFRYVI